MGAATMSDLVILFAYMLEFARPEGFTLINLDQYGINLLKHAKEVGIFFFSSNALLVFSFDHPVCQLRYFLGHQRDQAPIQNPWCS